MGIHNSVGISRLYPIEKPLRGQDAAPDLKAAHSPESFFDMMSHVTAGDPVTGTVPDGSGMTAREGLALFHRMKIEMNESLLRILSDAPEENSSDGSFLTDLRQMPLMPSPSPTVLSKIQQVSLGIAPEETLSGDALPAPAAEPQSGPPVSRKVPSEPPGLSDIIRRAAEAHGVDEDLIHRVIQAESSFRPDAVSPKGAMGLMQLMPKTAKELGVVDPMDPEENIMGGTRYLKKLLDRYDGSVPLALAAYNWGMGNLDRHRNRMPEETRNYIAKITGETVAYL